MGQQQTDGVWNDECQYYHIKANNMMKKKKQEQQQQQQQQYSIESKFGAFENRPNRDGTRNNGGDRDNDMGDEEMVNIVWKSKEQRSSHGNGEKEPSKRTLLPKDYGFQYDFNKSDDSNDSDDDSDEKQKKLGREEISFLSKIAATIGTTTDDSNYAKNENDIAYSMHLLGKTYHPIIDYALRREDESKLFWFSYRCDFVQMKPNGITSDAGWGCMLRAAQMLLGQALKVHYCGRDWTAPKSSVKQRSDTFMQDLSMWLADFPSACTGSWYSIHNMVAAGLTKYDIMPGEWFGPGSACHVIRDLSELHERAWERKYNLKNEDNETTINDSYDTAAATSKQSNGSSCMQYQRHLQPVMRVYVAPEGCVFRQDIEKLMNKDNAPAVTKKENKKEMNDNDDTEDDYDKVDFDALVADPLSHPLEQADEEVKEELQRWDTALLVLVPLRLGLKTFNAASYKIPLSHVLSFPQSVGFLGGLPRHALWFYGSNSDGSKVYGLDPHTVQRAPRRRRLRREEIARTGNTKQYQVQLTDEYLRSLNCPSISSMDMSRIDPSLALGFYCRDRSDFELLCASLENMKTNDETKNFPSIFSVGEARPDYNADLSSAMVDMMMGCDSSQKDDDDHEIANDDDDFVMI